MTEMLFRHFAPFFFIPVHLPEPGGSTAMLLYNEGQIWRWRHMKAEGAEDRTAQIPSSITVLRSGPALSCPGCLTAWERWIPNC